MRRSGCRGWWLALLCAALTIPGVSRAAAQQKKSAAKPRVHTYYIAADEVEWDYAPSGINKITGKPFNELEQLYTERGPHRIGKVYRKVIYREYTDASFTKLKPRPARWEHLGILGPVIQAEVGDTIKVVFKNNGTHPYSIHPHGVFYEKASEGVAYNDGTSGASKIGGAVPPGQTYTYVWEVPERAGPGPGDPSSVVWLYHSHVNELKDVDSGLIGSIIITRRGMSRPDGMPKDVDREFVTLYMIFDENQSWYLDHNIQTYAGDPKGVNKGEAIPVGVDGAFSLNGTGFADANLKFTINGYLYGNLPMMTMKKGERVRWYVMTLGFGFNFHTPHWHGNTVLWNHQRTDVLSIAPAQMLTADMVPDAPGIWMYHCHVSDHMDGGMITLYQVLP
jgi:FtsP/CotA-like multicopper oxidase with cupredoxin domain